MNWDAIPLTFAPSERSTRSLLAVIAQPWQSATTSEAASRFIDAPAAP